MIGVVLWSDPQTAKAVFWCEDQGDFAYYSGSDMVFGDKMRLVAGDLVEFQIDVKDNLRTAVCAKLVAHQRYRGVQERLRASAAGGVEKDAAEEE
ncbi:MAG: hypothetical protein AAF755_10480 [Pseudomonadota bacterium]